MKTNNPNGRPKTAPDGKRRTYYGTVKASPAEATTLDTLRRPDEAPGHMLGRVALAVAVDPVLSAAVAAKERL